jgi:acetyltransferase-like isoleucine patch superfamily enzyme
MIIKDYYNSIKYKIVQMNRTLFLKYLKKKGIKIGKNVFFVSPKDTIIDLTRPYLIEIGNDVLFCPGIKMLTHGADWFVLREIYHRPFGSAGTIKIGNNVFIGHNVIILKNIQIGNNVIIGSGSIITKDVPDNCIVAGNPAKIISNIEKLYNKYLERELIESKIIIDHIRKNQEREPNIKDFREFFHLFLERDKKKFYGIPVQRQVGKYFNEFMKTKPKFNGFDEFIKYFDKKENN